MITVIRDKVLKNHALRAIVLALVLLVAGEFLLAWQYQRLAADRVEELEERLEEQGHIIEERAAQDALRAFLEARISQNERNLARYVTENTMQQSAQGTFEVYGVQDYEIQKKELAQEGVFRFQVAITRERLQQIEFITLVKILEEYYVHSVELAG